MSTKLPHSKKRGRPKDVDKAKAILNAAGCEFSRKGMSRTTMQSIADAAGVSKYTLYSHFDSKQALFERVIQSKCAMHLGDDLLETAYAAEPFEGLCIIGQGFVNIIFSEEALAIHRTVMSESRHDSEIANLFFQSGPERVLTVVGEYLHHLKSHHGYNFKAIEHAAEVFTSLFTGVSHMQVVLGLRPVPSAKVLKAFTKRNVENFLAMVS